jgi:hypothetical protein
LRIGIIPIGISRRHRYNARFQNSPSEHFITEALMAEYIGFSSEMKSPEDEIVGVRMYNLGGRAASEAYFRCGDSRECNLIDSATYGWLVKLASVKH